MTLVEILIALVILGVIFAVVGQATGMFAATVDASKDRSDRAVARAALDARMGEVSRTAPQLGDLTVVGANAIAFRKRQAPSAAVCSYTSPTLQMSLSSAELANLRAGDSVAVRDSRGTADPSDDVWDLGVITSPTQTGTCNGKPTVAATMSPAPTAGSVAVGATVRVWSTRAFSVQTAPANEVGTLSGSVLTETINGANAARAYGPFVTGPVFTYLDANGNTAASAASIRLVRATFAPIAQRQRQAVTLRPEHMEWPIGSASVNVATTPGDVPVVTGPTSAAPRCNTPGATNFGSTTDACAFPPPVAVANATPNPVTTGTTVTFDLGSSYDVAGSALTSYNWTIGGSSYAQKTVALNLAPGNVCWTATVTNARNLTSSQQSGCVSVYAMPTTTASGTPNPVTVGQSVSLTCTADGKGRSVAAYQWSVDGVTSSGQTTTSTLSAAGNHSYQCRAQTDLGAWSAWSTAGTYTAYAVPTAGATVSPTAVTTGQTITYDPRASNGYGRAITSCLWNVNGTQYNNCAVGTLSAPGAGNDCWTLQVQNDLGAWSSQISGCTAVYAQPTVVATVSPSTQNVGDYVTFTAAGLDGKGRAINGYNWSSPVASGSSSFYYYCPAPGTYTGSVQVRNDLGSWGPWSSVSINCVSNPSARGSAPASVVERNNAVFDASGSSTPGGSIVAYNWWIEGVNYNGNYPTVTRTLNNVGTVNWQVQVENQWGTWSGWVSGSVSVAMQPCQYNSSISAYDSNCKPATPNAIVFDNASSWSMSQFGNNASVSCLSTGLTVTCSPHIDAGLKQMSSAGAIGISVTAAGYSSISSSTGTRCVQPYRQTRTCSSVAQYSLPFSYDGEWQQGQGAGSGDKTTEDDSFNFTMPAVLNATGTVTVGGDGSYVMRFHVVAQ